MTHDTKDNMQIIFTVSHHEETFNCVMHLSRLLHCVEITTHLLLVIPFHLMVYNYYQRSWTLIGVQF